MRLFTIFIEDAFEDIRKNDVRIVFIGDRSVFREDMQRRMAALERESAANRNILNVALNYGSRSEIVHAVNTLIERGEKKISVEMLNACLYTRLSPDPDLIVRTAGEQRLSNFLLWQAAYSEFYYTDTLWPDMNGEEVRPSSSFLREPPKTLWRHCRGRIKLRKPMAGVFFEAPGRS